MNWPPVFHLQWLGHVPHVRQHLPTTIAWNSPMRELIGSEMVSSLLLLAFGTLSLLLYFQLPSTFLPSKGRSITTLGTRWHDFFLLIFLDILQNCFNLYITLLFLFSRDADSRKGTLCPFCVPIHKKKKKKKKHKDNLSGWGIPTYLVAPETYERAVITGRGPWPTSCCWFIYIACGGLNANEACSKAHLPLVPLLVPTSYTALVASRQ